ncbi:AfsR/SARP family transcriptional regulator [Clostridium sp. C105KSO13]|uniref:AfsR/SARP family transcriptional regulator n=1 Tax=Clostridium sp. C105KSO13 TaxID=1776045 RepID=UPI0007408419|nr:BTAD domain-containing putative transcriptional regulator [Clostridium sp. C105KSO13]CUX26872.1 Bacterial transcriptional activator domain protein [Clostridium sp. C105KSO13]
MRRKHDLRIRFFNEFSISSSYYEYAPSSHNSTQLALLISYLVANRDTKVPKEVLMSMLWPEEKGKEPVGALRNLVYRARKELQCLYPDRDVDYIKFTQDAYYWNPDLYCQIDIVDFENYNNQAHQETDPERQFRYYYRMSRLHTGEFLSNLTSVEWVQYRYTYYKNMYINCALNMCEYLYTRSHYDETISLCDKFIILYPEEEGFYRYKILSYLRVNSVKTALEYYHTTLDFFSSRYGTDISDSLRNIHQEILARLPNTKCSIDELEVTLEDTVEADKTFYCNLDIFKNIYQLKARSAQRSEDKYYLLLLTLLPAKKDNIPDSVKTKEVMNALYRILSVNLRKNDVFTRTSLTQYSVILTVTDNSNLNLISQRILKAFKDIHNDTEILIDIDWKIIE